MAVVQPNGIALKAITVTIPGRESVSAGGGSGWVSGGRSGLMPSRNSPLPEERFEGIIFHVASGHAYLWCIKLGFVYMPRVSCEALLSESGHEHIYDYFQVGDWLAFRVISQKPKYNCEFRISQILEAVSKPEGIDCWMGREPSFDTPQFMARGVGLVGAVPTLEYGIVYSEVLGRIYFRSEHIRARTMPKPLTRVQFTAMIDQTGGFKDGGWRAIEVAPATKDAPAPPIRSIRKCQSAVVKSHYNKCSWLITKEVGEIFASCEKDFWIRIDDGDALVGKTFSAYIVPYPYGQGSSKWRALYVYPKESMDAASAQPPMTFPLPPPTIPLPIGQPAPTQPLPPPPPIPTPLLSTIISSSVNSTTPTTTEPTSAQNGTESTTQEMTRRMEPTDADTPPETCRQMMSEQQIASLEEELLELELSGINRLEAETPEERVFEQSGASSLGLRSLENGHATGSLEGSSYQNSRCQSSQNPAADFPLELEDFHHMMNPPGLSGPLFPSGAGSVLFPPSQLSPGVGYPPQLQGPVGVGGGRRVVMVDNFCQTNPSKEKELLMKIMNNKDLFTACMVKFPDLVFEICKAEALLPSM